MFHAIKNFKRSEDGAVTVDWVVLTAAVVGLAIAAFASIHTSTGNVGDGVGGWLSARTVGP